METSTQRPSLAHLYSKSLPAASLAVTGGAPSLTREAVYEQILWVGSRSQDFFSLSSPGDSTVKTGDHQHRSMVLRPSCLLDYWVKVRRVIASTRRAPVPTWTGSGSVQWVAAWAFPGGSVVKESVCQCNRLGRCRFDPWVGKIPWSRKWQPLPVFLPGKSHGQRSLVGYSLWGWEESDTTEHTLRYLHDFLCPCLTSDRKPGHPAIHSLQVSSSCHSGFARVFPWLVVTWDYL